MGLRYPRALTVSPDGRFLYVTAFDSDRVILFARQPDSGDLAPIADGCWSAREQPGCHVAAGLDGPTDVAVSRDGRSLYVVSYRSGALTAFARDPATGMVSQLAGAHGCVAAATHATVTDGCVPGRGLAGAFGLAASADGRSVYVASRTSGAVAVFDRDASSGAVTQKAGTGGCLGATAAG